MTTGKTVRSIFLCVLVAAAAPAFAQVTVNITVGPPAPLYEAVPVMAPGYVWAPGYWAWHGDRHIWVRGRTIVQRVGYRWEPDVWEQRSNVYYRHPGRWERDSDYRAVQMKPEKPEKPPKYWKDKDKDKYKDKDKGHGKNGKSGNGKKNDD